MEIVAIILLSVANAALLIAAYGVAKKKRTFFLLGIFIWTLIPITGEITSFIVYREGIHMSLAIAFIGQSILVFPDKINFTSDNVAAMKLVRKIGLSIFITNFFQGLIILNYDIKAPMLFAYFHFLLCLIISYPLIKSKLDKDYYLN